MKDNFNNLNFKFKKNLGQNFIFDKNFLNSVVEKSCINKEDLILEIGPGAGTLTEVLSNRAKLVCSYEIDKDLIEYLENKFLDTNVKIFNKDILKVQEEEIEKIFKKNEYKIFANLPYYITTPIIMKFIEAEYKPTSITVMVQKEVADRILSKEGKKEYGSISAIINLYAEVKLITNVSRKMFKPEPNVDSAIIQINIKKSQLESQLIQKVSKVIHSAFKQRRKTLINNLSQEFLFSKEELALILKEVNLDKNIRGEKLSVDKYIELTNKLYERYKD